MQTQVIYSDERILTADIKAGNPAAKHWFYDHYSAAIYGVLLQLVPDEQKASELLLKIFVWIFDNMDEYYQSGGLSLFLWVLKKTREIAVQEYPDAELTGNEANVLIQFSKTLNEQCKQAFVLCYCKGLSRSNAAGRMGVSEQMVYQLLKEAMIAFRIFSRK